MAVRVCLFHYPPTIKATTATDELSAQRKSESLRFLREPVTNTSTDTKMKNSPTLRLLLLPVFLIAASSLAIAGASAKDLAAVRQKVEAEIASLPATAHFDQPYAGTDNPKQMLDLFLPKEPNSEKPLPVVVFIHGGAWKNGDRITSSGGPLNFVKTGHYAGIAISYRLTDEAKWPAQIHDCKAAIRWIRGHAEEFGLDPEKIGVWGSSAGGHLVSLLGTSGDVAELEGDLGEFPTLSSRVACVANFCGPQDFTMPLMYRNGEAVGNDPAVADLLGGSLTEMQDVVLAASPVTYVTADDPPFLTLHGTKDERVDFAHAERIHQALTAAGVASILIPVMDGGHGISHPDVSERLDSFFDRNLRGMSVEIPRAALTPSATAK